VMRKELARPATIHATTLPHSTRETSLSDTGEPARALTDVLATLGVAERAVVHLAGLSER
jgi:hypothetical protein